MTLILAIDQSTSGTKAVLFDPSGQVIDRAARDHEQFHPQPGWIEHDAAEIWRSTLSVIQEVADRNRTRLEEVAGISIANQRETVVAFDRTTGRPLDRAIVWQCRRSEAICEDLRRRGYEDLVRRKTGLRIDTYFSGSKISWIVANRPEILRKLEDGSAVIGTMDSYLIHRLTGGRVFATDPTNASRTLLYDISALKWDGELCRLFDAPIRALPEVRESSARFGSTTAEGILPREVPIVGVMGDSQASLYALHCDTAGATKATFGTGTSVMLNIGRDFRESNHGTVTALARVRDGVPTYALEGLINFSAATVAWLGDHLGLIRDPSEAEALATCVPDNGGVYLVPAFAGLGTPHWAPDARAAIIGMSAHTRREHVVRAGLESIAYQIRDVLEHMTAESSVAPKVLHVDGGPTRNRMLMQFTADITGTELRVSDIGNASAWGAAMNGYLGLGVQVAAAAEPVRYGPRMSAERARELHGGWLAAVKRVL